MEEESKFLVRVQEVGKGEGYEERSLGPLRGTTVQERAEEVAKAIYWDRWCGEDWYWDSFKMERNCAGEKEHAWSFEAQSSWSQRDWNALASAKGTVSYDEVEAVFYITGFTGSCGGG
ncbi:hypothetical protein QOT17_007214 [Balamuthia mandrillaris]